MQMEGSKQGEADGFAVTGWSYLILESTFAASQFDKKSVLKELENHGDAACG